MKRAKVIATSDRPDTYVDVLAAIAAKGNIDEIVFVFLGSEYNDNLLLEIQKGLIGLSNLKEYVDASRLKISHESVPFEIDLILKECDIVDVTGVPKQLAIEVAAKAITKSRLKVCHLKWLDKFEPGVEFRVGQNTYSYEDLLTKSTLRAVRKDFVAKRNVITAFAIVFGAAAFLAIAQLILNWEIPDKWVSVLSLLVGIGGLRLAYISLRPT